MFSKGKEINKAINDIKSNLANNVLVEKNWNDFKIEISDTFGNLIENRQCDNWEIFEFGTDGDYKIHVLVADYVFKMFCVYIKELIQD